MTDLALPLGVTLAVYVVLTYAMAFWVQGRVHDVEDFLVAGRRLPLRFAWATILATWFGAGTMLTAADEVRAEGLRAAALEPFGAGLCLILAGLLFARKLWRMKILTLSDFFARRFGRRAELLSAIVMVPGYFGWIAVQFVALAGILELFVGLDHNVGIALVAAVGMGYTVLGGMWAVTITDVVQVILLLAGLVALLVSMLTGLGDGSMAAGFGRLGSELPPDALTFVPTESTELIAWVSVVAIAALGNIPGQDLMQRVFASRSERVARAACVLAGVAYLAFGAIPVMLGLAAQLLLPGDTDTAIVPALAAHLFSPAVTIIFCVALTSAVLSTIDSAILSPSAVLAQNVFPRIAPNADGMKLNRIAVVLVTAASLIVAYVGESAYELLEAAYEIGLMGLFVPLAIGLWRTPRREAPALATMGFGAAMWALHLVMGWDSFFGIELAIPASLPTIAIEIGVYLSLDFGPVTERD